MKIIAASLLTSMLGILPVLERANAGQPPAQSSAPIPWSEIGAKAQAQYQGDGLSVSAVPGGARLRCVFQKMEGDVSKEGLWLASTLEGVSGDRFRVIACAWGRDQGVLEPLARSGRVQVESGLARWVRPDVVEEYSVSMDGVRQDFVVAQRKPRAGELKVELEVTGARAEAATDGARLVLDGSGRKIAYSRLQEGQHSNSPGRWTGRSAAIAQHITYISSAQSSPTI